jgi:hypothetical protein
MLFLAVAVATALVYAVWVLWVPLLPDNLYTPLLDLGKITGYRWPSAILYLLIVICLFGLYAVGYRFVASGKVRMAAVFAAAAIFCAELVWAYPATAVDVFGYVAAGRLLALHHVNPFVVTPRAYAGDPILPYLAFPDEPSQYGPIWVLLGGAFATIAQGNLLSEVLLYKGLAALAHLGGAAMTYLVAHRLTSDPRTARASAYLYAWNPMLLWEMIGNAHNDGVMMFFGLIAAWLFVARHDLLVLAALAAGALVKVPLALIGPTLLAGLWRRGWQRAVEGALLAFALAAALYRPFWEGTDTLTALHRTELFTASLGSVLRLALAPSLGLTDASSVARTISLSAFAVVAVISLLFAIRAKTASQVLTPAYATLLAGVLLATTWFQAWYVAWPFALGAALGQPRRHLEVALLSLGGLLQYFVFIYLWVMGLFPAGENLGVQSAAYLAIIGPLIIGFAVMSARQPRTSASISKPCDPPAGEYH